MIGRQENLIPDSFIIPDSFLSFYAWSQSTQPPLQRGLGGLTSSFLSEFHPRLIHASFHHSWIIPSSMYHSCHSKREVSPPNPLCRGGWVDWLLASNENLIPDSFIIPESFLSFFWILTHPIIHASFHHSWIISTPSHDIFESSQIPYKIILHHSWIIPSFLVILKWDGMTIL